jgi:hypothetical protein
LDWGIWKLFTSTANYGLGVAKNMNPPGNGQPVMPGGEMPPFPGSATSAPLGLLQGFLPSAEKLFANPPGNPRATLPYSPSGVTAATQPSQDPGVAPASNGGGININTTVNANGVTDPRTIMAPAVEFGMNNGRTTAFSAPAGVPGQ